MRLLSITKLQNLKAIHNTSSCKMSDNVVVINHKTTKFESNSQQFLNSIGILGGCYQSQNYKIWKQFTTYRFCRLQIILLLSITKLQNLKAIHNLCSNLNLGAVLLSITKLQNLKAIHNTTHSALCHPSVVINHKATKFESNSQHLAFKETPLIRCYQSQNYKIWKQFTTQRGGCIYRL